MAWLKVGETTETIAQRLGLSKSEVDTVVSSLMNETARWAGENACVGPSW